jgi:beta-glucosidase/6-phospho-beta-glucosidase/beta-galactosidase
VDQSDDDTWKTTDMGWGVHPEGMRSMLNYIQTEYNPRGVSAWRGLSRCVTTKPQFVLLKELG